MKLIESTPRALDFIKEWNNSCNYIIAHTSGSTGTPKEIRLLKSDMIKSAEATCQFFNISSASRIVCPLSADYIAGKMMIVRAWISGCELIMEEPSNRPINNNYGQIDLLPIVPSQIPHTLTLSDYDIKNIIIGGAPISSEIEQKVASAPFNAYATYGMTETCSHVALRAITNENEPFLALPSFSFSTDHDNCLRIDAPLFSFKSLQTNDIVNLIDSSRFHWLGRRDNVIITGGLKVIPEEVESKISHLVNNPFYIAGVEDSKWGQHVELFIESKPLTEIKIDLSEFDFLPPHQRPRKINFIPEFARTSSGKIRRLTNV